MRDTKDKPTDAGLPGDPPLFKALTEIQIISHLVTTEFERMLPNDMTEAQFGVLNHLLRLDVEETIGELAAAFQVTQPTMSSTVKRLEAKSYITIILSPDDRRVKRVRVTTAGKEIRNQIVNTLTPRFQEFASDAPNFVWEDILPALTALRDFLDKRR